MGYYVIHMLEAADCIEELEYSKLVEQCRQIHRFLSADEACTAQVCITFSDKAKEIQAGNGAWPGEAAFRRTKRRKKTEKNEQKICFEEALHVTIDYMEKEETWIIILYTAGAVKRSKRTILTKWKKALPVTPDLLAVKTEHADRNFLESYTEKGQVFEVGKTDEVIQWLNGGRDVPKKETKGSKEKTELWKVIRDCFT